MVSEEHDTRVCHHTIADLLESCSPTLGEAISVRYSDLMAARIA